MSGYNKVILMGNLTRDPDTRITPTGMTITKIGIAVSRKYKTQDGQQHEDVTFVDVDAFGKQAEVITKYFTKGKPIMLEGRLKLDQWQDKETGSNRQKLGVVLEQFQFISSGNGAQPETTKASPPDMTLDGGPAEESDDVPF